jgi:hypothetical protein
MSQYFTWRFVSPSTANDRRALTASRQERHFKQRKLDKISPHALRVPYSECRWSEAWSTEYTSNNATHRVNEAIFCLVTWQGCNIVLYSLHSTGAFGRKDYKWNNQNYDDIFPYNKQTLNWLLGYNTQIGEKSKYRRLLNEQSILRLPCLLLPCNSKIIYI